VALAVRLLLDPDAVAALPAVPSTVLHTCARSASCGAAARGWCRPSPPTSPPAVAATVTAAALVDSSAGRCRTCPDGP
jgi:hypothetical protein